MATAAPLLASILLSTPSIAARTASALNSTSASTGIPVTTAATLASIPAVTKAASTSYLAYRLARVYLKNARVTPVVGYLAYKGSGYADQGGLAGMTISDFVAVWTPYNTGNGTGRVRLPGPRRAGDEAGGTKKKTAKILAERQRRDARPARQSVQFGRRRRHFCLQEGCERTAL